MMKKLWLKANNTNSINTSQLLQQKTQRMFTMGLLWTLYFHPWTKQALSHLWALGPARSTWNALPPHLTWLSPHLSGQLRLHPWEGPFPPTPIMTGLGAPTAPFPTPQFFFTLNHWFSGTYCFSIPYQENTPWVQGLLLVYIHIPDNRTCQQ